MNLTLKTMKKTINMLIHKHRTIKKKNSASLPQQAAGIENLRRRTSPRANVSDDFGILPVTTLPSPGTPARRSKSSRAGPATATAARAGVGASRRLFVHSPRAN
jgi:hypothetical protein